MTATSFRSIASLLLPVDPRQSGVILEAPRNWTLDLREAAGADVVVWGREPLPSGAPRLAALRSALARDGTLARIRRRGRLKRFPAVQANRFPPTRVRGGRLRHRLRARVLGGLIVELAVSQRPDRVLDAVSQAAGSAEPIARFDPRSGGLLTARIRLHGGQVGLLRTAPAHSPADPAEAAEALRRLKETGIGLVPGLLGTGISSGASWTLETILPGHRPDRLTPALATACAGFCATLPVVEGPAAAVRGDIAVIASTFEHWAGTLDKVAAVVEAATASGPAVLRHGDLWLENVMVAERGLAGITDWDAWHPSGVPGADLLHLVAADLVAMSRRPLGEIWLTRPWRLPSYRRATAAYWPAVGIRPDPEYLEAVGLAWWATQVAGSLSRMPELATDTRWVEANVDRVLSAIFV